MASKRYRGAPPGMSAFIGPNGHGKTLKMMEEVVLPSFAKGIPVLANLTLFASAADCHLPSDEREPHPLWVPMTSWRQILELDGESLAVDEVGTAFSARESASLPFQVAGAFQQLRKPDAVCGWTAPDWKRADVILRECTDRVTLCSGRRQVQVEGRQRGSNTRFRFRIYDRTDFDEFSLSSARSHKSDSLKPMWTERYNREKHDTHHLYDTFERVHLLDHMDSHGHCLDCGGHRPKPKCTCIRPI